MNQTINETLEQQPPEEHAPQAGSFKDEVPWLSLTQFLGSGLLFLLLLVMLGFLAFSAVIGDMFDSMAPIVLNQALVCILVIPSIWLSFKYIAGAKFSILPKSISNFFKGITPYSILLFLPVWLIGSVISNQANSNPITFFILNAAAVIIPVVWLIWFATRGLESMSAQRKWGLLTAGMTLSPGLVLLVNLLLGMVILVVFFIGLAENEWIIAEINREIVYIESFQPTLDEITSRFEHWLSVDTLKWQLLLFIAVFTPLVEEFFKVFGLWFLAKRIRTPEDGFKAGVIAGAGFTLVESLSAGIEPEGWAFTIALRIIVGLMHIAATGLLGWGLAKVWQNGKFWKIIFYYLGAVLIHGFWNGFVILLTFDNLGSAGAGMIDILSGSLLAFVFGTISFTLGILFLLNFIRRKLILQMQDRKQTTLQEI